MECAAKIAALSFGYHIDLVNGKTHTSFILGVSWLHNSDVPIKRNFKDRNQREGFPNRKVTDVEIDEIERLTIKDKKIGTQRKNIVI